MARRTLELQNTLSQRDVATAQSDLAAARSAREAAEAEWAVAVDRRKEAEAFLEAQAAGEQERLDAGTARAGDLVQAERFAAAMSQRVVAESQKEASARVRLQSVQARVDAAESSLATARLGERAVEARLEGIARAERTARDDAHDEESQEAAAARRRGLT